APISAAPAPRPRAGVVPAAPPGTARCSRGRGGTPTCAGRSVVALVGAVHEAEPAIAALQQAHAAAWGTRARAPAPGCRVPHEETAPARPARREARLRASAGTTLTVGPQVAKPCGAQREERAAL